MSYAPRVKPSAHISAEVNEEGILTITIDGRLDSNTTGKVWREAMLAVDQNSPKRVILDASGISYCDDSGIALLIELRRRQGIRGGEFEIRGLAGGFQELLDQFPPQEFHEPEIKRPKAIHLAEELGRATLHVWEDAHTLIAFLGEAGVALVHAVFNPHRVRWKDVFITAESIGVNAFLIIALVNFLIGLVLAFQSAIPLEKYGGQLFIADLVVLSVFRELGPLITAVVVNGRTSSAFAAELGTMRVSEEIDALTTMGLDPVRFLVVPKVIAAIFMIPILTAFGVPFRTYRRRSGYAFSWLSTRYICK